MLFRAAATTILLFLLTPPLCSAENTPVIRLDTLKSGYFFKSNVLEEGVVQLSNCSAVAGNLLASDRDFNCKQSVSGYRCTGDGPDVIFTFKDLTSCQSARTQLINSEEE